jgi:hypothetical protein
MVPYKTCFYEGMSSIRYKKLIEHLPTAAAPKKNIKNVVKPMLVERNKPANEISCKPNEKVNMIFLP